MQLESPLKRICLMPLQALVYQQRTLQLGTPLLIVVDHILDDRDGIHNAKSIKS